MANTLRQERKTGLYELRDDPSNFRQLGNSNTRAIEDDSKQIQMVQCDTSDGNAFQDKDCYKRNPVTTPLTEDETTVSSETFSKCRSIPLSRHDFGLPPSSSQSSIRSASTFCSSAMIDEESELKFSNISNISLTTKASHLYVSTKTPYDAVMNRLSRPRQKIQNALLYPLTEDTFNESGKLSLLQQRLLFRLTNSCRKKRSNQGQLSKYYNDKTPSSNFQTQSKPKKEEKVQYNRSKNIESLCSFREQNIESNKATDVHKFEEYKEIELIYCNQCRKSYSKEVYERRCKVGRCTSATNQKRKIFSSARVRIMSNSHLSEREKSAIIETRKKIVAEKKQGNGSFRQSFSMSQQNSKWKTQSEELREAMKANRLIAKAKKEGKPAHYYL